ncbi:MAG: transporter substrate-binding domain-containing protein [Proteobacteria bacterium]|nr:transporter substrate-binding domain-containing protein [Pseudomonadota bacterium]
MTNLLKRFACILFFILGLCQTDLPAHAHSLPTNPGEIRIVTSEFAPLSYSETGVTKGFCTEIVQGIVAELGVSASISVHPWARAYQIALKQKNTLIYTIARTPEREPLFQWVGVLISGTSYLFSLKNSQIRLSSYGQANGYKIGAARNDARSKHLMEKGVDHLDIVATPQMNAIKLINRRIDLWVEDELVAAHTLKRLGYQPFDTIQKVFPLDFKLFGYLAFSLETDKQLVIAFKTALEKIIANGTYDKIKTKYL